LKAKQRKLSLIVSALLLPETETDTVCFGVMVGVTAFIGTMMNAAYLGMITATVTTTAMVTVTE
jgi:hypothetical protein